MSLEEIANLVAVLGLVGLLSLPIFGLLSVPGVGACLIVKRYLRKPFWARAVAMSAVFAGLLTPVPVPGHSPLILPFPFGLWLTLHMENNEAARVTMYCAGVTFVALCLLSWRYWRRERAGVDARGWVEPLWRGRPTRG